MKNSNIVKAAMAENALPTRLRHVLRKISSTPGLNEGILAMEGRSFPSATAALLAGVAMVPEARKMLEDSIDSKWGSTKMPDRGRYEEVIIGGGLHAAIYCGVRARMGAEAPLVVEAKPRAGGAFAVSREPSFYLNSRNRPGGSSIPGQDGALNVLPGALVQPADLSGDEYQHNGALAYSIRTTLAATAKVAVGKSVMEISRDGSGFYNVYIEDGSYLTAKRVIISTGLGRERRVTSEMSPMIKTFSEFMNLMDTPFPLKGMRRVAVIGAGDSGRTVIEALTGQGPTPGWSVASIDWLDMIDWYGQRSSTRQAFEECNRSRYRGIARLLPDESRPDYPFRVLPMERAQSVSFGYGQVYVNERPYDMVVDATGWDQSSIFVSGFFDSHFVGGRVVGMKSSEGEIYKVGPSAQLNVSSSEERAFGRNIPENSTAIFRYAPRTAALAGSFEVAGKAKEPFMYEQDGD